MEGEGDGDGVQTVDQVVHQGSEHFDNTRLLTVTGLYHCWAQLREHFPVMFGQDGLAFDPKYHIESPLELLVGHVLCLPQQLEECWDE